MTHRPIATTRPRAAFVASSCRMVGHPHGSGIGEPQEEGLPSFNESGSCGENLSGVRGPLADAPGILDVDEPIYGPWADFYGRTVGDAWDQRVSFQFPTTTGSPKTFWVHERLLPALQPLSTISQRRRVRETPTRSALQAPLLGPDTPSRRHAFSFHAVGAALDINSTANPYRADNVLITDMPTWFVDAWRSAGWCWGGDWSSIKDAMHFSWRGPLFTPGYTMPPPQPPLVAAASFSSVIGSDVRLGPVDPAQDLVVVDIDRDGAPDVVGFTVRDDGTVALDAAPARNEFHWLESWGATVEAPTDASAPRGPCGRDERRTARPHLCPRGTAGCDRPGSVRPHRRPRPSPDDDLHRHPL